MHVWGPAEREGSGWRFLTDSFVGGAGMHGRYQVPLWWPAQSLCRLRSTQHETSTKSHSNFLKGNYWLPSSFYPNFTSYFWISYLLNSAKSLITVHHRVCPSCNII